MRLLPPVVTQVALGLALALPGALQAATFRCDAGDVACLIAAMHTANANGDANTIRLEAGAYTLTAVDNTTDGPNGLPSVTSTLTLQGAGTDTTSIERQGFNTPPLFRLLHVAATGQLTLTQLTLRGGFAYYPGGGGIANAGGTVTVTRSTIRDNSGEDGGGILNIAGRVTLTQSTLEDNHGGHDGAGFVNNGGMVTVTASTIAGNTAIGSGLLNYSNGTVIITDSTITDNGGDGVTGTSISNGGVLTIRNSTIARNFGSVSGISNSGQLFIVNSTIADNADDTALFQRGNGIVTGSTGSTVLLNTILARNGARADCTGRVTSQGTNLIGNPTGCTLTLQPTDLTGDPGLGDFIDDGTPGQGYIPLLSTSQAINAGNDAACPTQDQLGRRRVGRCDIGAVEFPAPIPPPVILGVTVQGDFNGDGVQDEAGLTAAGFIWVGIAGQPWRQIPGWLTALVAGDLDGNGIDDLAGLGGGQTIWVTMDTWTWQQLPGYLTQLVIGDLYGDGKQHLAGLHDGYIFRSPALGYWEWIPGWLTTLVTGDFNGDGRDDLAGIGGWQTIWAMTDMVHWQWLPGYLQTMDVDRQAQGQDDLLGTNAGCAWRMHPYGVWNLEGCSATVAQGN